jgi:hypothetical protein
MVVSDPLVYHYCTPAGKFVPDLLDMSVPLWPAFVSSLVGACMHEISTICGHVDYGILHAGTSQMDFSCTRVTLVATTVGGRPLPLEPTAKEPRIF